MDLLGLFEKSTKNFHSPPRQIVTFFKHTEPEKENPNKDTERPQTLAVLGMRPRMTLKSVPTITQVIPGAYVNIVLKQDQPTGRTVQGIIQNVLTRGNHPRGIKVRLSDGRVGRVQTMAVAGGGSGGGDSAAPAAAASAAYVSAASAFGTTGDEAPREQIGLDAYIRPAKKQQKRRGGNRAETTGAPVQGASPIRTAAAMTTAATTATTTDAATATETTTCPVCGDFEGDEAAVSHHVSSHFD